MRFLRSWAGLIWTESCVKWLVHAHITYLCAWHAGSECQYPTDMSAGKSLSPKQTKTTLFKECTMPFYERDLLPKKTYANTCVAKYCWEPIWNICVSVSAETLKDEMKVWQISVDAEALTRNVQRVDFRVDQIVFFCVCLCVCVCVCVRMCVCLWVLVCEFLQWEKQT